MKTLSHGFDWLRRLAFVVLLMGIAGHALAAKTYADNGDGTVTDPTTGLIWMRCAMGQVWDGTTCTGTASTYTFDQANALTGTTTFAGHSDWRLPSIDELKTLIDQSIDHPTIDQQAFPATPSVHFETSTSVDEWGGCAWVVDFSNGLVSGPPSTSAGERGDYNYYLSKSTPNAVRMVRGGQASLALTKDWNLLGNGWNQSLPVASVFGDATRVTTVWKWDVAKAGWQFYSPTMTTQDLQTYAAGKGFGVLSAVGAGEGFWVNVKQPFTVILPNGAVVRGVDFQSGGARALAAGWNLIAIGEALKAGGFNSALSTSPPVASVVPQNLSTLWAWDNAESKWYFYSPQLDAKGGTALTDYIASKGYLDFTAANRLLLPGTGFWVNKP